MNDTATAPWSEAASERSIVRYSSTNPLKAPSVFASNIINLRSPSAAAPSAAAPSAAAPSAAAPSAAAPSAAAPSAAAPSAAAPSAAAPSAPAPSAAAPSAAAPSAPAPSAAAPSAPAPSAAAPSAPAPSPQRRAAHRQPCGSSTYPRLGSPARPIGVAPQEKCFLDDEMRHARATRARGHGGAQYAIAYRERGLELCPPMRPPPPLRTLGMECNAACGTRVVRVPKRLTTHNR